jgi:hypothetical protein
MKGKCVGKMGEVVVYDVLCGCCKFFQPNKGPCSSFDMSVLQSCPEGTKIGTCHIRSVPSADFPERYSTEWCGEHQPNFNNEPEAEERKTSDK